MEQNLYSLETQLSDESRASHEGLSPAAAQFLEYLLKNPERARQLEHLAADLPPWTRTYPSTELTWPTFVGVDKMRQIKRAVVGICQLVKTLPDRIFEGDPQRISDFYGFDDASLVELLLEPPNGIEGAVARCDFIDGSEGFGCCEVNMTPNVGGWESRFWEQKYLTHPAIRQFIEERGINPAHHDPLRTFCAHIIEDTVDTRVWTDGMFNVAVMMPECVVPSAAGIRQAQETYSTFLREADGGWTGHLVFCSRDEDLPMKGGYLYHGDKRIHAVVNYLQKTLPQKLYLCQKAGTITLYNGALTLMMADKRNLALLSQFEDSDIFNAEERTLIHDHVPWSRIVAEGETTHRGKKVDLPELLITQRDDFVLKLGLAWGGTDVHVGRFISDEEWKRLVADAITDGRWMTQEYIQCRPYLYANGDGEVTPYNVVWGMFCCGSRYGGGYLRMLPQGIRGGVVNSSRGAIESPIFEV